jgi:hypothetical protein
VRAYLILVAAVLSALAPVGGAGAQTLSGIVVSGGSERAGVSVIAEADGRPVAQLNSDADGRFKVDFSPYPKAQDFTVTFSLQGFRKDVRLLDRAALERPLKVALVPMTGATAIPAEDEQKLKSLVTLVGTGPLVFVPYSLPAGAGQVDAVALNERLRAQLQRLIVTHVQLAATSTDIHNISLTKASVDAGNDLSRLRAVGQFVNAIAVVSGIGFGVGDGVSAPKEIELASSYVIIPQGDWFDPPFLSIVDTVPSDQVGRFALDQKMSRMWGRATILALAARDLKAVQALKGEERRTLLQRIQRYVIAERANVGAADELGAAKLKELVEIVARELGR